MNKKFIIVFYFFFFTPEFICNNKLKFKAFTNSTKNLE